MCFQERAKQWKNLVATASKLIAPLNSTSVALTNTINRYKKLQEPDDEVLRGLHEAELKLASWIPCALVCVVGDPL